VFPEAGAYTRFGELHDHRGDAADERESGFLNTRQETDSGDRRAASPTGREKSM
jgi:hypothetical protein